MGVLPRADEAIIPAEKFTKYSLNPDGDFDKHVAFEQALGYNLSNSLDRRYKVRRNAPYKCIC